jgi:hypothetical protein
MGGVSFLPPRAQEVHEVSQRREKNQQGDRLQPEFAKATRTPFAAEWTAIQIHQENAAAVFALGNVAAHQALVLEAGR